jgi:hypothetical protein
MAREVRRHRLKSSSDRPHQSANQNIGWVMADISFEKTNIQLQK